MIVEVVGIPISCAVVITSFHWFTVILPGEILSLRSWSKISADVPGKLPTPADFKSFKYCFIEQLDLIDPYKTSSGEKPCI